MLEVDRLAANATTEAEVFQYYKTRGLQFSSVGYRWNGNLVPRAGGFLSQFTGDDGQVYDSFYVLADHRNRGVAGRLVKEATNPILTMEDCHIEDFLAKAKARGAIKGYVIQDGPYDYPEYKMVERFYGTKRATRSRVYLMNHIDEGLYILSKIGASHWAKRAFCLHPMLQADADLAANFDFVAPKVKPITLALAMEYRNLANQWLSDKVYLEDNTLAPYVAYDVEPKLSPLEGVNRMLIADKVQNYKDFILYHKGTHPRSIELDTYFQVWLKALGVDNFTEWFDDLNRINPK